MASVSLSHAVVWEKQQKRESREIKQIARVISRVLAKPSAGKITNRDIATREKAKKLIGAAESFACA